MQVKISKMGGTDVCYLARNGFSTGTLASAKAACSAQLLNVRHKSQAFWGAAAVAGASAPKNGAYFRIVPRAGLHKASYAVVKCMPES